LDQLQKVVKITNDLMKYFVVFCALLRAKSSVNIPAFEIV